MVEIVLTRTQYFLTREKTRILYGFLRARSFFSKPYRNFFTRVKKRILYGFLLDRSIFSKTHRYFFTQHSVISTSVLSIGVRNHTHVLPVVKTSHIGVILDGIGVTIRANQPRRSGSEKTNWPSEKTQLGNKERGYGSRGCSKGRGEGGG